MSITRQSYRKTAIRLAASAGAIAILFGSGAIVDAADGEEATLAFVSWGGTLQDAITEAWLDPYSEENSNIDIVVDGPPVLSKLKAMVESGNVTWDVVDIGPATYDPATLLEPLDCEVVECDKIPEGIPFNGYGMPFYLYMSAISYRTDKVEGTPENWADYFDFEKFPGKRAYTAASITGGFLEKALMADGVAPADLYPLDVERALKKLDTVRDNLVFWNTSGECARLLSAGEVVMADCASGRIQELDAAGEPVGIQWNQSIPLQDVLAIPKGSKNVAEAMKLIAYITSGEHGHALGEYFPYGSGNVDAIAKQSSRFAGWYPSDHSAVSIQFNRDQWYEKNGAAVEAKVTNWLTGG